MGCNVRGSQSGTPLLLLTPQKVEVDGAGVTNVGGSLILSQISAILMFHLM